ncbi:MAG: hypothetical protein KAX10_02370 [Candidatus Lokiarchaeota archaeon]|nr:hypothetical protein [Candidatus Lokiarchaeota archaeon]
MPEPIKTETIRIYATLESFYAKIVENLVGVFGKSHSGVINDIVKDWINEHMEELKNVYGIDVVGIRHELQWALVEKKADDILKILNEVKEVIKGIKRMKIDDLGELVGLNRSNLLKLIIKNNDKLNVVIDGDYISPKKD